MWNDRLDDSQAGISIAGENINNLRYAHNTTVMAEREEEVNSFLMKVKEESESWLKIWHSENENHGIWSHHFIANRLGKSGNTDRVYFLGSKITADGECSHEIKRCLFLGRKAMIKLDSVLKSRDITLPTKVHIVKGMVFPVIMYNVSWTIKKAEHGRIDAFKLRCLRRLLRVLWTARRSSKSILKEINPEYSWKDWFWSWSSNLLATWCEEWTHWKRPWCWERLKTKGEGGGGGWDG